jgi:ketosteroid isomerase-like protein
MATDIEILERVYGLFNARDMESVLSNLHPDVVWANGMEGGHVHGRDGVREYWTRQWATIHSHVRPLGFSPRSDDVVAVDVHLIARDLDGHVLFDKPAVHVFRLQQGLITRFDIE